MSSPAQQVPGNAPQQMGAGSMPAVTASGVKQEQRAPSVPLVDFVQQLDDYTPTVSPAAGIETSNTKLS